jgi:DNA-binding response OmpR family regulator
MAGSNVNKRRILFVEDDEDSHELVGLMLTEYQLVFAGDFANGLRLARQGYFDLYILDNWLPDGSGIELCRRIREFDPHTPILFYSAAAYGRDVQEALLAGAQIYVTKPSDLDELKWAAARLVAVTRKAAYEAYLAELAAVREELAIRSKESALRFEEAKGKRRRAEEKALRAKAKYAFLVAKGTRGDFARLWPNVYLREICNRHGDRGASLFWDA